MTWLFIPISTSVHLLVYWFSVFLMTTMRIAWESFYHNLTAFKVTYFHLLDFKSSIFHVLSNMVLVNSLGKKFNIAQCPIWHINVTNSLKFTKFLLRWKVDFFSQRGYQGAKHVHYLYFQSSRIRIYEEIVVFLIISRKKSLLAWTGKK